MITEHQIGHGHGEIWKDPVRTFKHESLSNRICKVLFLLNL